MHIYIYIIFSIFLIFFFLGLSLISPGGLFVLDFVITPFIQWNAWYATTIQWHFVDIINFLLGYEITTKLYYLFVFVFGLFVSGKLGRSIYSILQGKYELWILQSTMTIFLLCNPWTYERLITQPGIALGMFSIVLGIHYLLENILPPKTYSLLWASISFGFSFMFFPHASLLILLIGSIYCLLFFKTISLKYYILSPLLILLPNVNWIIGDIFYAQNLGTTAIESFDWANIQGFIGNSLSGLGVEITHLLLYGFWGERFHILTPEKFNEYWYIFGCIALCFIIWGNICLYRLHKKIWVFLTSISTLSFILALGISSDIFGFISHFLYSHIPLYAGMREPQKWLGLTMIGYSIFFTIGILSLKNKIKWMGNGLFLLLVFVLLNTWNPMNIFGFQGQLYGSLIPREYHEISILESQKETQGKYLILPWHTYMSCNWTHSKNISSMQEKLFYPLETVVADNLEIHGKYSNSNSEVSKDIENFLSSQDANKLKENNITHIIYQKNCGDVKNYLFLGKMSILEIVTENNALVLYKINYEK